MKLYPRKGDPKSHFLNKMNRKLAIFIAVLFFLAVLLLPVSGRFQWSPLNCWHQDVDIRSGRIRHTRFLYGVQVSEHIEESWLSRAAESIPSEPTW
jgi:hypothetical protein